MAEVEVSFIISPNLTLGPFVVRLFPIKKLSMQQAATISESQNIQKFFINRHWYVNVIVLNSGTRHDGAILASTN